MNKTTSIDVRHDLTDAEINELASELAIQIREFGAIQSEKKSAMSEFKGRLDASDKVIQEIAKKIMDGYFMEVKACNIENDYVNQIRLYRDVTSGEILKSELFTEKLQQSDIFDGALDEHHIKSVTVSHYPAEEKKVLNIEDTDPDENY